MQNKVFEGKTTKSNNYKLNFKTKLFGYSRLDGKNIQDNIVVKKLENIYMLALESWCMLKVLSGVPVFKNNA